MITQTITLRGAEWDNFSSQGRHNSSPHPTGLHSDGQPGSIPSAPAHAACSAAHRQPPGNTLADWNCGFNETEPSLGTIPKDLHTSSGNNAAAEAQSSVPHSTFSETCTSLENKVKRATTAIHIYLSFGGYWSLP